MGSQKAANEIRRFANGEERQSVARPQEAAIFIKTNGEFHSNSCIRQKGICLQLYRNFFQWNLVLWIVRNRLSVLNREVSMFDDLFIKIGFPIGNLDRKST